MREQVVMGPSSWMLCAAVTLTLLWGALCAPSCPSPCLCEGGWLINCSSVGPSLSSLLLQISVTTLDLSRNSLPSLPLHPHQSPLLHLTHLHLGQNRLTDLSVCEAPPTGEGQCETWTPNLELLSAERNQLQHIPKGLCGATALHTLHLSYNRISALRVGDLQGCAHLRELHLQHNLISTLEPLVFRELLELRTLDLSFNALSTFPVPAYLSLSSLRVQVEVGGNPWRCDCSLQALRSWMGVTHNTLRWQLQCAEPPDLAGRDFLLLHDTDLTYDTPTVGMWPHQEVTVHLGTEILLPCGVPDQDFSQALWWTPNGSVRQASVEHGGGLMIQHISEQDQGLYVCISGPNQEPTSMFTVRVRAGARGGAEPGLRSGKRTHDELALAVCLSVFLTFIAAFAIGALTRPYLDTLWEKVQAWRRPVSTPTPYENAGFAEEEVGPEAERAGLGDASKPYYITIIPETDGSQCPPSGTETDTAAKEEGCSGATYENVTPKRRPAPQPTPRQSQGEEPCHQGRGADQSVSSEEEEEPSHPSRTIEFEPIPDPKDLGIEELSTTESDQSNQDLSLESHQDLNMDSAPDHDSKHDLGPNLEQKPDDDLGPELDLHRVAPCDPFSISREDLETDWLKNTRSPGENPFPAPAWTDSPWEPHPNVAQTPPQDGIQPDLDPELWNDSGESFEFTDSLQEESTRGGSSLAQQLKERPWSPFHQSVALQQVSNDPAVLRGQPQEGEGQPLSLSGWASPSSSSSSEESDQPTEHMPSPEITAIYPENTTIHPDNTVLHPVNTVIHSNDTALNPENTALHREDTTIHPDNAALHPESTEIHPKNTAFYPEVTPIYPQNQPLHPKNPEIHSENTAIHQEDPRYEGPTGPLLLTDMTHPQLTGSGRADAPWPIQPEVMLTLQQQIQREDILIPLQPTQQEDMPTTLQPFQQEDTLTALRSIQQDEMPTPVFPSHTLHPAIQFDTQRKEPIPFEAPLTTPTQGSQRQDWRRGGQFFQRRRVIDTFSTDPQASSQPGSAQLTFSQVTVVTTATDERRSQWFRLGEGGEEQTSAATAEEGHVTSDPMSGFLFGTSNDKGSEA
ncbi:hypothetical protein GJAV_G00071630 [Gymnothorax javanicus]|nr:hypothetical protein GJAV_G00071630 [Gymnothorax javanicus]